MAWVDDRIWCHPKISNCSKPARWSYVAGVAYSTGFQTRGYLTDGQLKTLGVEAKEKRELITAGLWDRVEGGVQVHDWDDHNSKRDAKRALDRDRKRRQRERERHEDSPTDVTGTSRVTLAVTAQAEGSEGSDGSDGQDLDVSESPSWPLSGDTPKGHVKDEVRRAIEAALGEEAA